jgi:predicted phosphodiesterase
MTKLAILADIHGNLPALEAVADDLACRGVDRVVVAGDLINWGPFSAAVLERVARAGWAVIRGNHEFYLLDYDTPRAPAAWRDRARFSLLPWLHRQLAGPWQTAIAAWPDTLSLRFPDAPPLRVVHGSPASPWLGIRLTDADRRVEAMLAGVEETTLLVGHIHRALDRTVGGRRVLNPGPVGVPLDGHFGASYLLLEGGGDGWTPTFRRVPYDRAPLFAEFARQRFVEECGAIGRLVVEEFATARPRVTPFLRWRAACCPDAPLTVDLLAAFAAADLWDCTPPVSRVNPPARGES